VKRGRARRAFLARRLYLKRRVKHNEWFGHLYFLLW